MCGSGGGQHLEPDVAGPLEERAQVMAVGLEGAAAVAGQERGDGDVGFVGGVPTDGGEQRRVVAGGLHERPPVCAPPTHTRLPSAATSARCPEPAFGELRVGGQLAAPSPRPRTCVGSILMSSEMEHPPTEAELPGLALHVAYEVAMANLGGLDVSSISDNRKRTGTSSGARGLRSCSSIAEYSPTSSADHRRGMTSLRRTTSPTGTRTPKTSSGSTDTCQRSTSGSCI